MNILTAISLGGLSLLSGSTLILLLIPWAASFSLIAAFMWAYGSAITTWLQSLFLSFSWAKDLESWLQSFEFLNHFSISSLMGTLILILTLIPFFYLISLLTTSILMVPWITKDIRRKSFPEIKTSSQISFRIIGHSLKVGFWYVFWWLVTLPFFFIPILGLLIPITLNAWVTQRLLPIEILSEITDYENAQIFTIKHKWKLFSMSLIFSVMMLIPLAFFFVPIWATSSFTFYLYRNYLDQPK